jgi:hypothetical protein
MALTTEQWFLKIKSWLPDWWFEQPNHQVALLHGIAAIFAELDQEADNHVNETFISKSTAPVLDAHGDERNVDRLDGELDGPYSSRIRYIVNQSNPQAIKTLVDSILARGKSTIREHDTDRIFCGQSFFNRHEVFTDAFHNVFSIVVDKQVHAPYSFLSRGNFAGRNTFVGTGQSDTARLQAIVAAVNKSKAFGVMYRLTETND